MDRVLRSSKAYGPKPKLAAKIEILREIVARIEDDLPGLRDRALLLLGFAGAFRRSELARIAIADLEESEHGLRIFVPFSKGDRERNGVQVGVPYGTSALCPVRALKRWCDAASITQGPIFRRIWTLPRPPGLWYGRRAGLCCRSAKASTLEPWRGSSRPEALPPALTPKPSAATA